MNRSIAIAIGAAALLTLSVILSCVYSIYPTDQVLLTELGAPKAVISEPGLHFKIPFLQYANFMPRQLLNLQTPSEEVIAQGIEQTPESIADLMIEAKTGMSAQLEAFAANAIEYMKRERTLLLDGVGIPGVDRKSEVWGMRVVLGGGGIITKMKSLKK